MRIFLSSTLSLFQWLCYATMMLLVCDAWVVLPRPRLRLRHPSSQLENHMFLVSNHQRRKNALLFVHFSGPFFGPEEEIMCPDEEECEIDWDLMPDLEDSEVDDNNDNKNNEKNKMEVEDETDVDMQPRPSYGTQALQSLDKSRVNLEMNWQLEECETNADSCTDFCQECAGSGRQPCRFCRGTGMFSVGTDIRPCLVCSKYAVTGQEDCSACRGTGQIATWASTMEDYMKDDHQEKNYI